MEFSTLGGWISTRASGMKKGVVQCKVIGTDISANSVVEESNGGKAQAFINAMEELEKKGAFA